MSGMLAVPAIFFDDHIARFAEGPVQVVRGGSRVWLHADDPFVGALRSDAAFYADPARMDTECCPRCIIESAKRTVAAIDRAGGAA